MWKSRWAMKIPACLAPTLLLAERERWLIDCKSIVSQRSLAWYVRREGACSRNKLGLTRIFVSVLDRLGKALSPFHVPKWNVDPLTPCLNHAPDTSTYLLVHER